MCRLFYIPRGKSWITMIAYYILTNMSDNIMLNILWSISYIIFKNRKQILKFWKHKWTPWRSTKQRKHGLKNYKIQHKGDGMRLGPEEEPVISTDESSIRY